MNDARTGNPYAGLLLLLAAAGAGGLLVAVASASPGPSLGQQMLNLEGRGVAVGTILLAVSLVMLPLFWFNGLMEQRGVRMLLSGECWVRWRYGEEEWNRFTADQWERGRDGARRLLYTFAIGLFGAGLLYGWSNDDLWLGLKIGAGAAIVGGPLLAASAWAQARATYKRRLLGPGEVLIGPGGIYRDGRFFRWLGMGGPVGAKLIAASDGSPAMLQFPVSGRSRTKLIKTIHVRVPQGQEEAAIDLVERISK
jgi:hypothetical protein